MGHNLHAIIERFCRASHDICMHTGIVGSHVHA